MFPLYSLPLHKSLKLNKTYNYKFIQCCYTSTMTTNSLVLIAKHTPSNVYKHKATAVFNDNIRTSKTITARVYSTTSYWSFTKKSNAAKTLAAEGSGKHTHKMEAYCEKKKLWYIKVSNALW